MIVLCCHESLLRRHCMSVIYSVAISGSFTGRRGGHDPLRQQYHHRGLRPLGPGDGGAQPRGARRAPSNVPLE